MKSRFASLIGELQRKSNRRITQVEIAKALDVSPSTVSRWMKGDAIHMTTPTLERICVFLECEPGDLLYMDWEVK